MVAHERNWQVDLTALTGETIEADLVQRDLTINAIAQPLAGERPLVDPFGGREDLDARRLRTVSAQAFARDPLRALRLARLACELDFAVDPGTLRRPPGQRRRPARRSRPSGCSPSSAARRSAPTGRWTGWT